jgi:fibronectin-binding autotransporter adhesin
MIRKLTRNFTALLTIAVAPAAFAASQTWTNAPTTPNWNTAANWNGNAVPGAVNITGNNVNNDVATFNTPLFGGIGGESNPILTDDATTAGPAFPRSRQFGGITFDTPNVGAYVIKAGNPTINMTDTNFVMSGVMFVSHNGSIQMTAGVTNNQTILGPLFVRLPSSTAGIYNFVNNSTNAATLYIEGATNNSANTRGTDFRLGGSNTGTNTIAALSAGTTTTGGNGLTKQGSGTWILSGPNDFRAGTVISIREGLLIVKDSLAFSIANTATITNTGVLQVDGVTLNQVSMNLHKGGTIRMNGTASVNGIAVGAHAATTATLATTSASDVFTVGTGLVLSSVVSGGASDSVLNTAGPGTIALAVPNTYVGNWSFNAATNQLINLSLANSRNVNVSAGAILDVSPLGGFYTLDSVSFSANGSGTAVGSTAATINAGAAGTFDFGAKPITLSFAPTSFSGDTTHPALYVSDGSISLSGNFFTINNTSGTPLGVGTYRLIQQASGSVSVSGGPFAVVLGAGLAANTIGDIQVSGGNVNLVVSAHTAASLSWQGGNPDNVWDSLTTANWNNGVGFAQFGNGDAVTFNSIGSANPTVNIPVTVIPSSVVVDTAANDYTLTGAGQIAGPAGLTKINAGVLTLQTANAYLGGTTVSNGTLQVGVAEAIPSAGSGNVAVYSSGTIDLNGFNNTINGLSGNGSVDVTTGGNSVLTVGDNDSSGAFSGVLKNTSGALALVKLGAGSQTLSAANTLAGGVTLSAGTLVAANPNSLGTNVATVNSGTLVVPNDLFLGGLTGGGGSVANNTTTTTNTIVINGDAVTTFGGTIVNGSGGGGVAVKILTGSLTLSGVNTYTGGTTVGSGASLLIANGPAAVTGGVIASNGAVVGLAGGGASPGGTPTFVTTVDGAKVLFTSGAEGKLLGSQFNGSATATNRFIGSISASGPLSFSNFLGVVEFANTNEANSNFRFFNGGGISGGENTLFVFERVNVHTRDSQTVRLGAIVGGSSIAGIGDQAGIVSWEIGAKNTSTDFHGYISGLNNSLVKVGSGTLTLDGIGYSTNVVTLPDPFEPTNIVSFTLQSKLINYAGSTTVNAGVLKIVAPNNLTDSTNITLAGGTLDATQIGYATNQTTLDYNSVEQATNTVVVTSGIVQILDGQGLHGQGSLLGSVTTAPTSTMNIGNPIGTLAISGSISLNGMVNMGLDRSNLAQNSDRITAASFSGSGAVLNVTNAGPTLLSGTTFQLFSGPVSAFATVNLPATDVSGQIAYSWQNNISVDGSITLVTGLNPNPAPITSVINGGNLELSWPVDHIGWTLQNQTNALNVGLTATWFSVAGSAITNFVSVPVNPANPTVFYRLTLPLP